MFSQAERSRYKSFTGGIIYDCPDGIVLRPARPNDLSVVINITKGMFGGIDFMPTLFLEYLNDPERYLFVAEHDGKVVATIMTEVVDNGTTLIIGGARSKAEQQGAGVAGALHALGVIVTLRHHPRLRRYSNSFRVSRKWKKTPPLMKLVGFHECSYQDAYMSEMLSIEEIKVICSPDAMVAHRRSYPVEAPHWLQPDELTALFKDQSLTQRWFPGGVFMSGPDPYRPMVENIPILYKYGRRYVSDPQRLMFTTPDVRQCEAGLVCDVKMYGTTDIKMAMAHLLFVMKSMPEAYQRGHIMFLIALAEKTDSQVFMRECKNIGFRLNYQNEKIEQIVVCEKDFPATFSNL